MTGSIWDNIGEQGRKGELVIEEGEGGEKSGWECEWGERMKSEEWV